MQKGTKIALFVALAAAALFFGWRFKSDYTRLMNDTDSKPDADLLNPKVRDYQEKVVETKTDYHLGAWGAALVVSVVLFGLMAAHEASQYFGGRALKVLYDDYADGIASPDYEKAEQEWAKGNHLEAIRLMREYLTANPREQHVALRIAEIYEKDLENHLAAALEYEEVLKQKLPPERWGWAAIHLCNVYTGKLNQLDKAVVLLQRICTEYSETAAADKARKRLDQLVAEGMIPPSAARPAPTTEASPPAPTLPPGFGPKKA